MPDLLEAVLRAGLPISPPFLRSSGGEAERANPITERANPITHCLSGPASPTCWALRGGAAGSDGCCFLFQGRPGGSSGVLQRGLRAEQLRSAGQHPLLAPRSCGRGLEHPTVLSWVGSVLPGWCWDAACPHCSCSAPVALKAGGFFLQPPFLWAAPVCSTESLLSSAG